MNFKDWLKNKFTFIKNLLLNIKNRVLGSIKVEKDGVSFSFPKRFNENTDITIAPLAGFAFEEECYLALSRSGLKDLTENFDQAKYKKRRNHIGEELYSQIEKDAEQFSKIMIAHAKQQMECIDSVLFMGGQMNLDNGKRSDSADIKLLCSEKHLGYSLKYTKKPNETTLAIFSARRFLELIKPESVIKQTKTTQSKITFNCSKGHLIEMPASVAAELKMAGKKVTCSQCKEQGIITPITVPDLMTKTKVSFRLSNGKIVEEKNISDDVLTEEIKNKLKSMESPKAFTDLLNVLINGGANTVLGVFDKSGGKHSVGYQNMRDDFIITNNRLNPKEGAVVEVVNFIKSSSIKYKTNNREYEILMGYSKPPSQSNLKIKCQLIV